MATPWHCGGKGMAEPETGPGQWLTQSEAASRLGWHVERIKSAARRGRLQRRKNNQGQWLVLVTPELAAELDHAVDMADDHAMAGLVAELREELTEAKVAAALADGKAAALLETLLDLRHGLEHERAERAKLTAELAEARKGWLERLLEALRGRPPRA
jgi:hypothetical protein